MGSRNQVYKEGNPNMVNASFSAPKEFILTMEMLIERGIYNSKSEIVRDGIRRILKDTLHILDSLNGIVEYVPMKRVKQEGNTRYLPSKHYYNNGYVLMKKSINED